MHLNLSFQRKAQPSAFHSSLDPWASPWSSLHSGPFPRVPDLPRMPPWHLPASSSEPPGLLLLLFPCLAPDTIRVLLKSSNGCSTIGADIKSVTQLTKSLKSGPCLFPDLPGSYSPGCLGDAHNAPHSDLPSTSVYLHGTSAFLGTSYYPSSVLENLLCHGRLPRPCKLLSYSVLKSSFAAML